MEKTLETLKKCSLTRYPYIHRYTTGNAKLDNYFELNSTTHSLPKPAWMMKLACFNYLLAILGIKQLGVAYTSSGYIVSYSSGDELFGTYLVGDNEYAINMLISNIKREFEKKARENPNIAKALRILTTSRAGLYEKCCSIDKVIIAPDLMRKEEPTAEELYGFMSSYKNVDDKNCEENHFIICRLICGDDEELYRALERYAIEKAKRPAGMAKTRDMDLIVPLDNYIEPGEYLPEGIGEEKKVRFDLATSIFDRLYGIIIDNYFVFSGGEVLEKDNETGELKVVRDTPDFEKAFSDSVKNGYNECIKDIRLIFKDYPISDIALRDIINICMLDYSNAGIIDLMRSIRNSSLKANIKNSSVADKLSKENYVGHCL